MLLSQEISDQAEEFLDVYNTYHKTSYNPKTSATNPHLYSILNTLFEAFTKTGQEDPLSKFQLYSGASSRTSATSRSRAPPS